MSIFNKMKSLLVNKNKKRNKETSKQDNKPSEYDKFKSTYVSKTIKDNRKYLEKILQGSQDIIYREFFMGTGNQLLMLVHVDGMVDRALLNENILKSMMVDINPDVHGEGALIRDVKARLLTVSETKEAETFDKLVLSLLSGDTLVFAEGSSKGLIVGSKGWEKRAITEPSTEKNVKGPKDCFIETLKSNIVLIRRRIRDPNLAVEMLQVGRRSKSDVAVVYLKGVIMDGLAEEIKRKIEEIDVDGIVDSGQLEQLIQEHKWTIFPQGVSTERPDKTASALLEGRAAILVDGSPFAVLVPSTFSMYLDAPDDYYERPVITSVIRFTRYLSFFLSSSLPGIYIAITNFHPGMLPPRLVLSITATRIALPFPTFVEMFIMEAVLEVLQEAGVRLPQAIGQTVSIVGGIVIGQAAVQAGLVSPIVVIVVSLTAITSFTLPSYSFNLVCRILRIPFMLAGASLGFFGIIALAMFILTHMASLESFGIGYFEDFSPYRLRDLKDTMIRVPKVLMTKRPEFLKPEDSQRQAIKKIRKGNKK